MKAVDRLELQVQKKTGRRNKGLLMTFINYDSKRKLWKGALTIPETGEVIPLEGKTSAEATAIIDNNEELTKKYRVLIFHWKYTDEHGEEVK